MTKENSVAVIYHCDRKSEKVIRNRPKLQRRLQRAIEDMVEYGFSNFILPLDERSPFPTSFIDAIIAEKSHSPNIRLTIMLPYEIEEGFCVTPAERLKAYTQYADEIIYNQKEYICGEPTNQVENLLDKSSALIIYYEKYCSQLSYITHQAQHDRLPYININL
ncbi:MAG: hypothetical protein SNH18_08420 [Rikenellaceae bacterium]